MEKTNVEQKWEVNQHCENCKYFREWDWKRTSDGVSECVCVRVWESIFRVYNNNKNDGMKDSFQLVAFLFINI